MLHRCARVFAVVSLTMSCGPNNSIGEPPESEAPLVVPQNFTDEAVTPVPSPTSLAFTPGGRLLIATQPGVLRIYKDGAVLPAPALDLTSVTCSNSERGLLGVAVDPDFSSNFFIYVYYTFKKFGACPTASANNPVNRVSRFTMQGDTAVMASELVLIDNIKSTAGNHNAGDLHFGRDGLLYVSVGDGGCDYKDTTRCGGSNTAARDNNVLNGKILRITKTGDIPPGNAFEGASSARCNLTGSTTTDKRCQEIYATGLRNPFRMAFDPNATSTRFFINDVGQNQWEEIDEGAAGADYGWNTREGFCANGSTSNCGAAPAGLTNPVFAYGRGTGCASITGAAFVPNGVWPGFDNTYLYADYVCGRIFRLSQTSAGAFTAADFVTDLGGSSAVTLRFGPYQQTQALYYTTYAGGGEVRRIRYTQVNRAPVAVASATPRAGATPLLVQFSGTGSTDADGDALTYAWTFGDGASSTLASPSHSYTSAGNFTATLVVRDGRGGVSQTASVIIQAGNSAPVARITAPSVSSRFSVGQAITLSGNATDAEDGALPNSALTWSVLLHHDAHTHPFVSPVTGNDILFNAPAPEDLAAAATSRLELRLTATDSAGLTHTVSQFLEPRKVDLTFATAPSGQKITANGTLLTAPARVTSWEGYVINVDVQEGGGYSFASWSDGGGKSHAITTPAAPTTYTARFGFSVKVNFQTASSTTPSGYLADAGAVFGARGNGFSYGWNANNAGQTRDRNAANSADQRYDTLTHLQKPENPNARWEIALPNGTYTVRLVSGDALYWDSVFRIAAEGTLLLSGTPSSSTRWITASRSVTVSDGRLTLSNASGGANNKLCFVDISQP